MIQHLPAEYVENLQPIIQTYAPLILNDRYSEVMQLKSNFERLGYRSYIENILNAQS